jgi:hypothetical protein
MVPASDHHATDQRASSVQQAHTRQWLPASYRAGRVQEPPELVAGMKQPRAVGAGKRGLGQPARRNASAATVQPEAAGAE